MRQLVGAFYMCMAVLSPDIRGGFTGDVSYLLVVQRVRAYRKCNEALDGKDNIDDETARTVTKTYL